MATGARAGTSRLWAPVAAGCAATAGIATLAVVDPTRTRLLPPCPIHVTTGLWCPGCGLTRSVHATLDGDLVAALGFNLLAPLLLTVTAAVWWSWLRTARGRPPLAWHRVPVAVWVALGTLVVLFTVLRNMPRFAVLAP